MTAHYKPAGYRAVTPGISAVGAPALADFLTRVFDARILDWTKNDDETTLHAALQIGDSIVEMSDARPEWPTRPCAIHLYSPDTDALFARAVEAGARILQPLEDAPYGDRAAAVEDSWGNHWYLATRLVDGPIPQGFHTLTPYVLARGADLVMDFARDAFGAVRQTRYPKEDGSVLHAEMRLDDSMIEIADGQAPWNPMPCGLHLYVPDADDAFARAIAAGGTSLYETRDMPYGDREGGILDPAGNHWYIATYRGASGVTESQ